jgi:diguanylate cyclase (GGDEF)-like protein/PAS domain S-box-containing protein
MPEIDQDFTERRLAKSALQESERNLRQAQAIAHIGSWTSDMSGLVTWSDELYRIYGVSPATFTPTAEAFINLIHPDDQPAMQAWMDACASGENPDALEFRCVWPDGTIRYIQGQGALFYDAEGKPSHMAGTGRDITERKQAEQALQRSEARLRAIITAMPVPLALNDDQGNITYLNQAFVQTLGYTTDDISTLADWWYLAYPDPQYRQWVSDTWRNHMNEATRANTAFEPIELNIMCKNGWARHFMVSAAALGENFSGTHLVILHDITQSKAAALEIQHLAFYDPLTQLPNRRLLLDRLQQALASSARSRKKWALLFIDLDDFKTLNDTLGHDIGDLLLKQVAQRLEACVREGDTVARLGGDEFLVILEDLSEHAIEAAAKTEAIGEKILASLSQPYQLARHVCHSTSSIGATLFSDNLQAIDDLMKQADIAMYQAKRTGRNALRFFDPQMQANITARVSMENELRHALEKEQFQLYYQIQVDSSRRPLGAEALIRWIHPERGLVPPLQFIQLAEETGLILPIGQCVLEAACAQIKVWQQDALTRDLVLAINVSANQFHQAGFAAQVQTTLQRHAINPTLLKLELTESLMLEDIEDTITTMNVLNEIGIQLSLDDFGTGFSSLQYLKRLPLDQIKIDRSFVRDIATDDNDKAIVRTIIAMAHSLNLDVIAEGVETEDQRELLLNDGCTHYQGYLFGKPQPAEEFEALLEQV